MAKTYKLSDETLIRIIGAPDKNYFMGLLTDDLKDVCEVLVLFPNSAKCTMEINIREVRLDKGLETAYFFEATSKQISGTFFCHYDALTNQGWMVKKFNNKLN